MSPSVAPEISSNLKQLFVNFEASISDINGIILFHENHGEILCSQFKAEGSLEKMQEVMPAVQRAFSRLLEENLVKSNPVSTLDTNVNRIILIKIERNVLCFLFDIETYLDMVLPYCYILAEKTRDVLHGNDVDLSIPTMEPVREHEPQTDELISLLVSGTSYNFKIIVIGDNSVGKTSLIYRYAHGKMKFDTLPTLGVSITYNDVDLKTANITIRLAVWDLGGQKSFKRIRKNYYLGAKGAILMYDISNKQSFENLEKWLEEKKQFAGDCTTVLIGNKSDLEDRRQVSREEALDFANKYYLPFTETSALAGTNVQDAFNLIALKILNQELNKQ
ncbi:MAG: Rab family GTPase [Promethearchaeota archaeon]